MPSTLAEDRRRCIYHFIVAYHLRTNGLPPTYQEIADTYFINRIQQSSRLHSITELITHVQEDTNGHHTV